MKISQSSQFRGFILCAALLAGFGIVVPSASAQAFLIDLNSKTATMLDMDRPVALNDSGQVTGWSYIPPDGAYHASSYHASITGPNGVGMTDLGTLGGAYSAAQGINDAGQVVGWSSTASGEGHAFITGPNGTGMTDLSTLTGFSGSPHGVNDAGQVVGDYITPEGLHAFITGPNGVGMTDLGTLGGAYSIAYGINDAGHAVGFADTASNERHAFITGPNGVGMTGLGTLGGGYSEAQGINDAGQAVGFAYTASNERHAFITGRDGVEMIDLGTLGGAYSVSDAQGINDAGQVVGYSSWSTTPEGGHAHAFITGPNGMGMMDLNSLVDLPRGVILTQALDINNAGQVLAISVVPEPEIYAMLLGGLGLVGFISLRRKKIGPPSFRQRLQL